MKHAASLSSRRQFLTEVGRGTLLAVLGPSMAAEFGISSAMAAENETQLGFGPLEPLVRLMQETPVVKLQGALAA